MSGGAQRSSLTWRRSDAAVGEGVARVTFGARAHGVVADDGAEGVVAARAWARVSAFLADARQRERAVTAHQALGAALHARISKESGETRAVRHCA